MCRGAFLFFVLDLTERASSGMNVDHANSCGQEIRRNSAAAKHLLLRFLSETAFVKHKLAFAFSDVVCFFIAALGSFRVASRSFAQLNLERRSEIGCGMKFDRAAALTTTCGCSETIVWCLVLMIRSSVTKKMSKLNAEWLWYAS